MCFMFLSVASLAVCYLTGDDIKLAPWPAGNPKVDKGLELHFLKAHITVLMESMATDMPKFTTKDIIVVTRAATTTVVTTTTIIHVVVIIPVSITSAVEVLAILPGAKCSSGGGGCGSGDAVSFARSLFPHF